VQGNFMQTYTLNQVADILKVTRQAIYLSKKYGKIKPIEKDGHPLFSLKEIARFKGQKYKRDKHFTDGYVSSKKAANLTGIPLQRIYYLIYNNKLKAIRKSGMWFILEKDLMECKVFGKVKRIKDDRKVLHPNPVKVRGKHLRPLVKKSEEKK
jgi:hypothetical protein